MANNNEPAPSEPLHTRGGSTPVPDPTLLTSAALNTGLNNLKEILSTRLDAMEKATDLRIDNTSLAAKAAEHLVAHLTELVTEKFNGMDTKLDSVQTQFKERDTRSERESRDNKVAVDAAFAAQKEASAKQDEANQKAIDKSEKATAETLGKMADLFKTTTDAISGQISDIKIRQERFEGIGSQLAAISTQVTALTASRDEGTGRYQQRGNVDAASGLNMQTVGTWIAVAGFLFLLAKEFIGR